METKYQKANPYRELSTKVLENFEQIIQYRLPENYRKYLLNFNGAVTPAVKSVQLNLGDFSYAA